MATSTPQLAMTRSNASEARCEALFASNLQPSDAPTAEMVASAINGSLHQYGISSCVDRMAQEFGEQLLSQQFWALQVLNPLGVVDLCPCDDLSVAMTVPSGQQRGNVRKCGNSYQVRV